MYIQLIDKGWRAGIVPDNKRGCLEDIFFPGINLKSDWGIFC